MLSFFGLVNIHTASAIILDSYEKNSGKKTISNLQTDKATVFCPKGVQVTGGGYTVWDGEPEIVMSKRTYSNSLQAWGWVIEAFSPSGKGDSIIQAHVMCGTLK